jgi:hypothetical protein
MTRPIVRIHDLSTDEVIDREMNDAEFAQYEADQAAQQHRLQQKQPRLPRKQHFLSV